MKNVEISPSREVRHSEYSLIGSEWLRRAQNGLEWLRMAQNGLECLKLAKHGSN